MAFKIEIFQFYDKSEASNGNETKSDIFPRGIFKSDTISFFLPKYIKEFKWLSKSKFLSFITKIDRNNGNESKLDIFPSVIFKSDTIFLYHILSMYFHDLQNLILPREIFKPDTKSISICFLIKKYERVSMTFKIDVSQ